MTFDQKMVDKIDLWIKQNRNSMVQDIMGAVNIKSVVQQASGDHPFGDGCAAVLQHMLKLSEGYGFETKNHENYCGTCLLKGTEGKKKIGIFAHLDVVPEGTGWEYEPYNAVEKDGYLIGRGVGDNKGPALVGLYALRFLKENEISLKNDVSLYYGCAEEVGMDDIEYYVKHNKAPDFSLVPDVSFPVCYGEKGILETEACITINEGNLVDFYAGEVSNTIAGTADAVISGFPLSEAKEKLAGMEGISAAQEGEYVRVTATGLSKHAAFPEGSVDAVGRLATALVQAGLLTGDAANAVQFISDSTKDYYGASLHIPYEDKESGKLTHVCSIVRFTQQELHISYNIRYPVTSNQKELMDTLTATLVNAGYHVEEMDNNPPAYVPLSNPIIQKICDISNAVLEADYKPYTMGGGTYSRKLPNAVAFGPGIQGEESPFPAGRGNGHQPDECIRIQGLLDGLKIYILTLQQIDNML